MLDPEFYSIQSAYTEILNEKTYRYVVPKDKEKIMYDFYALAYLDQFDLKNVAGRLSSGTGELINSPTMRRELDENTIDSYYSIRDKLLQYLKNHLSNAVFYAICAEFRHVADLTYQFKKIWNDDTWNDEEKKFLKTFFKNYRMLSSSLKFLDSRNTSQEDRYTHNETHEDYIAAYKSTKSSITSLEWDTYDFIEFAKKCFNLDLWGNSYGGTAWANICDGWIRLYNSHKTKDLFVAIDHIYDLQHNTDTVFNKLRTYYKDRGYRWIKQALDFKANLKSPYELMSHVSPTIKSMSLHILKSQGFEGWEDYLNSKENKKDSDSQDSSGYNPKKLSQTIKSIKIKQIINSIPLYDDAAQKEYVNKQIDMNNTFSPNKITDVFPHKNWAGGMWEQGTFKDGKWMDGYWLKGEADNIIWENGIWLDGNATNIYWHNGIWYYGLWKNGVWKNGLWVNGIWRGGRWVNGIWRSGFWKGGVWQGGLWDGGEWEEGQIWVSDLNKLVYSKLNPTKFFTIINGIPPQDLTQEYFDALNKQERISKQQI